MFNDKYKISLTQRVNSVSTFQNIKLHPKLETPTNFMITTLKGHWISPQKSEIYTFLIYKHQ